MRKMDQTATGLVIAATALALNGGLAGEALAGGSPRTALSHGPAAIRLPPETTMGVGQRSGRVLSLLMALEALRAAPGVLDAPNG